MFAQETPRTTRLQTVDPGNHTSFVQHLMLSRLDCPPPRCVELRVYNKFSLLRTPEPCQNLWHASYLQSKKIPVKFESIAIADQLHYIPRNNIIRQALSRTYSFQVLSESCFARKHGHPQRGENHRCHEQWQPDETTEASSNCGHIISAIIKY